MNSTVMDRWSDPHQWVCPIIDSYKRHGFRVFRHTDELIESELMNFEEDYGFCGHRPDCCPLSERGFDDDVCLRVTFGHPTLGYGVGDRLLDGQCWAVGWALGGEHLDDDFIEGDAYVYHKHTGAPEDQALNEVPAGHVPRSREILDRREVVWLPTGEDGDEWRVLDLFYVRRTGQDD